MPYDTSYDVEIDRLKKEINIYECQKHRQEEITGKIKKYIDACIALTEGQAQRSGTRKITHHIESSDGTCEWLSDTDEATARQAVEIRSSAV